MSPQRSPPEGGDGRGDSPSARFQHQIPPENHPKSILRQQIQAPQDASSILSRDCNKKSRCKGGLQASNHKTIANQDTNICIHQRLPGPAHSVGGHRPPLDGGRQRDSAGLKHPRSSEDPKCEDEDDTAIGKKLNGARTSPSSCLGNPNFGYPPETWLQSASSLSQVSQFPHSPLLPKTYAEVVRSEDSTPQQHFRPNQWGSLPSPAIWKEPRRRRRVQFINSPRIAYFHKDSAPATISLGRSGPNLSPGNYSLERTPKSCLKRTRVTPQKDSVSSEISEPGSMTLCVEAIAPRIQEETNQLPWRLVREKYWWRKRKSNTILSRQVTERRNTTKFKERVGDRCFNCLTRGHWKRHCRDPPRCWRCSGSGHISNNCRFQYFTRRVANKMQPVERYGRVVHSHNHYCHDGEDEGRDRRHPQTHNIDHVFYWNDNRGRSKSVVAERNGDLGRYRGEYSRIHRVSERSVSPPPSQHNRSLEEKRALQLLWASKNSKPVQIMTSEPVLKEHMALGHVIATKQQIDCGQLKWATSDAIHIIPQESHEVGQHRAITKEWNQPDTHQGIYDLTHELTETHQQNIQQTLRDLSVVSDAIVIVPQELNESIDSHLQSFHGNLGSSVLPINPLAIGQSDSQHGGVATTMQTPNFQSVEGDSEIQKLLKLFQQTTTQPISSIILSTPTCNKPPSAKLVEEAVLKQRKRHWLKKKMRWYKAVVKMAQKLIAQKWNIILNNHELVGTILRYPDICKQSHTNKSLKTIKQHAEVTKKKKKKEKGKGDKHGTKKGEREKKG